MTEEEAKIISRIINQADGGCSHCIGELEGLMNHYFPAFEWGFGDPPEKHLIEACEKSEPHVSARQ